MRVLLTVMFAWSCAIMLGAGAASAQGFTLYARSLIEADRRPSLRVTTNLPHANLVFLKKNGSYRAQYRVYYRIVKAETEDLVETAVATETVEVGSYDETRSHKLFSNVSKRFYVEPGDYLVVCTIRIQDTHLEYVKEAAVSVPDFVEAGIALTQPRLFVVDAGMERQTPIEAFSGDLAAVEERELASFAEMDKEPAFVFGLFLEQEREEAVRCDLYFQVVGEDKLQIAYGKRSLELTGTGGEFIVHTIADDWSAGAYSFQVKAVLEDPPRATTADLKFNAVFTRASVAENFDETVEILSLIAKPEEIDSLRAVSKDERIAAWFRFWKRRDPSPGTPENEVLEEHFRRLRYVEQNFSVAGPGWQSDRGRVYIRYGEPDDIEVRVDPTYQGQFLVWQYFTENLTFVFYDRFGLGEYRLTDSYPF